MDSPMTMSCTIQGTAPDGKPVCPFCRGDACRACSTADEVRICEHDITERHRAHPALMMPVESRVPTEPLPAPIKTAIALEIQMDQASAAAEFLRAWANILDLGGLVRITIERVR